MTALKYAKNIVTETKPMPQEVQEVLKRNREQGKVPTLDATRLLWLDEETVPGAYYMEFLWLWKGSDKGLIEEAHRHDFAELIGFIGGDPQNPKELGGEIDIWLDDEKHTLTKSCFIFIPKGLKHCPIRFNRIDKPVLWFTASPNGMYKREKPAGDAAAPPEDKKPSAECSKYIITELKHDQLLPLPETVPGNSEITRILYLDNEVAKGAFYMECVWFSKGNGSGSPEPHAHDFDEVLGFIGTDRQNPKNLDAEVELWLEDEKYLLHNSCLVFIPRGVKHCPMVFKKADRPVFHFSSGNGGMYGKAAK